MGANHLLGSQKVLDVQVGGQARLGLQMRECYGAPERYRHRGMWRLRLLYVVALHASLNGTVSIELYAWVMVRRGCATERRCVGPAWNVLMLFDL